MFFGRHMPAFAAEMSRLLRPGGILAITTWGPDWCEPASSLFWDSVRELEPTLFRAFNPWDELTTAPALADLLTRGGIADAAVEATTEARHELERANDFWEMCSDRATAPGRRVGDETARARGTHVACYIAAHQFVSSS